MNLSKLYTASENMEINDFVHDYFGLPNNYISMEPIVNNDIGNVVIDKNYENTENAIVIPLK